MIATIHQPEHLPWIGYFNKMSMADIYVFFDNIQYEKNYVQNRNRILGTNGSQWINVPVVTKNHMSNEIKNTEIANKINPTWKKKYLNTLYLSYKNHLFFNELFPFFEELLSEDYNYLCDFNYKIIYYLADILDIHPKFVRSSEMKAEGESSLHILNICKELGADCYMAGPSGRNYLDEKSFQDSGIKVEYHDFSHPIYKQFRTEEFIPRLSVIDLIFNIGIEESKKVVRL